MPDDLLPADLAAFEAYVEAMLAPDGQAQVSPIAQELAAVILHPPLAPLARSLPPSFGPRVAEILAGVPVGTVDWTLWPAVGLLPETIRTGYGLRWGRAERLVSGWLVASWRIWRPHLPGSFRHMPQALAADRRTIKRGMASCDSRYRSQMLSSAP